MQQRDGPKARGSAPLAVLDVNIWLDYFRDDEAAVLEEQRERLRSATRAGIVRPMLTATIVPELAGACEHEGVARYHEMMLFAWEVCEERLLAIEDERCKREIFWERRLTLDEALVPLPIRRGFREKQMLDPEWARAVAAEVKATQAHNHGEERAKRQSTIEGLDEHDKKLVEQYAAADEKRVVTPWREAILRDASSREALIIDWALDEMVTVAMHEGLPFGRQRLPDPRTLPSFHIPKVVHVHRLHGVLLENRSPTNTDIFDHTALQDAACYAEIFVTADTRLQKLAARTPLPIRVLNFEEWDQELSTLLRPATEPFPTK